MSRETFLRSALRAYDCLERVWREDATPFAPSNHGTLGDDISASSAAAAAAAATADALRAREALIASAASSAEDACNAFSGYLPARILRGFICIEREAYDQAESLFLDTLSQLPNCLAAIYGLGVTYLRMSDWCRALARWQQALCLLSSSPAARSQQLVDSLSKAGPLQNMQCNVRLGIGICFAKLGFQNEASAAFARVLEIDPKNTTAMAMISTLFLNAVKNPGTNPEDRLVLLTSAAKLLTSAHEICRETKSHNNLVYARLAEIFFLRKDYERSFRATLEATKIHSRDPYLRAEILFFKGRYFHATMNYDAAEKYYLGAHRIWQEYLPARYTLAQLIALRGELSLAIPHLENIRTKLHYSASISHDQSAQHISKSASLSTLSSSSSSAMNSAATSSSAQQNTSLERTSFVSLSGFLGSSDTSLQTAHFSGISDPSASLAGFDNSFGRQFYMFPSCFAEDYDSLKLEAVLHSKLAENPIMVHPSMPTRDYEDAREATRQFYSKSLMLFASLCATNVHSNTKTKIDKEGSAPGSYAHCDPDVLMTYARLAETYPCSSASFDCKKLALNLYYSALAAHKARKTNPPGELYNNIAVLHHLAKERELAFQNYQNALTLFRNAQSPLEYTVLYNIARQYEDIEDFNDAERAYHAIILQIPGYDDAHLRLAAIAQKRGKVHDSATIFNKVLERNPRNINARILLGMLELESHQPRAARKNFDYILTHVDKFDLVSLLQLGTIWLNASSTSKEIRERQLGEAWKLYDKVLQLDPSNLYAATGTAIALRDHGNMVESLRTFEQVRETDNTTTCCFSVNYAHFLCECNQFRRAIPVYERALAKFSNNTDNEILVAVARAYYLLGKQFRMADTLKQALCVLQKAIRLRPADRSLWFNLAVVAQDLVIALNSERADKVSVAVMEQGARFADSAIAILHKLAALPTRDYKSTSAQKALRSNQLAQQSSASGGNNALSHLDSEAVFAHQNVGGGQTEIYDPRIAIKRAEYLELHAAKLKKRVSDLKSSQEDRQRRLEDMKRQQQENKLRSEMLLRAGTPEPLRIDVQQQLQQHQQPQTQSEEKLKSEEQVPSPNLPTTNLRGILKQPIKRAKN